MKVDISVEFDKESAGVFMAALREISEGFKNLQRIFDKSDWSVTTEGAPEPKPKQHKPATQRKPRAKKTLRSTVLRVIKKNKDGISRKALQEETGFTAKQISNIVYQLKKNQKIEMTEDGLLKAL
ncbi:MAG: hypothetical protein R6T90_03970 [Dissulfuribacterales bacterium]